MATDRPASNEPAPGAPAQQETGARPEVQPLERRDVPAVFLNVLDPIGVATDADGYVYVSYNLPVAAGTSEDAVVGKFTPQGVEVGQPAIIEQQSNSMPNPIPSGGDLTPGPGPTGDMWDLQPDGIIYDISSTGRVTPVIDLKTQIQNIDVNNIVDLQTGKINHDFGGEIFPTYPSTTYGDIVIRGNDIFVTGYSPRYPQSGIGDYKFVEEIVVTTSSVTAQVILSSSASPSSTDLGSYSSGLAITPSGLLLTTLPWASSPVLSHNYDVLASYNLNIAGGSPTVLTPGLELSSQGMTTDAAGNPLIATYLNESSGPVYGLDVLNSEVNNASPPISLAGVNALTLGSTGDVAAAPGQDLAYVTIPGRNEVLSAAYSVPASTAPGSTGTAPGSTGTAPASSTPPAVTAIDGVTRSKNGIKSITIGFSEALNPASATNLGFYGLALGVRKKRRLAFSKVVRIGSVTYNGGAHTVTINLARPAKGTLQVVVRPGIASAAGAFMSGTFSTVVR